MNEKRNECQHMDSGKCLNCYYGPRLSYRIDSFKYKAISSNGYIFPIPTISNTEGRNWNLGEISK